MNPKTYLLQVQVLNSKINQRIKQIDELKSMLYSLSATKTDGDKVQASRNDAPFIRIIEKIDALERELSTLVDNFVDMKNKIIGEIQKLKNDNYMNLLFKRYVEGKRLEVVAVEMNYSYVYTKRMHGWALSAFKNEFLKDDTECYF